MCVWTKKWGSMKAVVLMATPCPKSLHGKRGEVVSGGQGCYRLTRGRTGPSLYREWVALDTGARFPS